MAGPRNQRGPREWWRRFSIVELKSFEFIRRLTGKVEERIEIKENGRNGICNANTMEEGAKWLGKLLCLKQGEIPESLNIREAQRPDDEEGIPVHLKREDIVKAIIRKFCYSYEIDRDSLNFRSAFVQVTLKDVKLGNIPRIVNLEEREFVSSMDHIGK
ncbi:hypothetical protein FRX31_022893 [Thalictrum thalictroides]|uniref:Uncharacterized protein n=1 Tax=Thalictrum thalictroides TaxID=46969 RepID=A0A7J6VT32_THATH|nr:hypothetical protein FRX31_022893 [Thalictrum thalictroides]